MFRRRKPLRIGGWPPTVAVSSWSVRSSITSGSLKIEDFPKYAKCILGLNAIEVLVNHLIADEEHGFRRLADAAKTHGVEVACLALSNDFTSKPSLENEIQSTIELLRMAQLLGASVVRINPGIKGEDPDEVQARNITEALLRLMPEAQKRNLILALENHQMFGMDPRNMLKVVDALGLPPGFGLCLDFGNFYPEYLSNGPALLAPYAVHVHAKSYEFDENGLETTIDYPARIQELKAVGYRGYLTIEWEGANHTKETESLVKATRLIDKCVKSLA